MPTTLDQLREQLYEGLLDEQQASYALNVKPATLYKLVARGLPYYKIGNHRYYSVERIKTWMRAQERVRQPPPPPRPVGRPRGCSVMEERARIRESDRGDKIRLANGTEGDIARATMAALAARPDPVPRDKIRLANGTEGDIARATMAALAGPGAPRQNPSSQWH